LLIIKINTQKIEEGSSVIGYVDYQKRERIENHHTATHLLHAALRKVIGPEITQKGSLVDHDRLRFDFSCDFPLSNDLIEKVET